MLTFFKKNFAFSLTILLIIIAIGGIAVSYQKTLVKEQEQEVLKSSGNVPVAVLERTEFDWGNIGRDTPVEQSFILKNEGAVNLEITKLVTSCGCTSAELSVGGVKMDIPTSLPPQSRGTVRVVFDPAAHDSRGDIKRAVRLETNDPEHPFLIINLTAYVE